MNTRTAILTTLYRVRPRMLDQAIVCSDVCLLMADPPSNAEIQQELEDLSVERLLQRGRNDLKKCFQYRITTAGVALLEEHGNP